MAKGQDFPRAPDGFASFLGAAADLGQRSGLDMPLLSNLPAGIGVPMGEESKSARPPEYKQTLRVARYVIGANDVENEELHVLLDKISNDDNYMIRQQKEQILNDGSIVVLVSYMILEKVVPKKAKDIKTNEEVVEEPPGAAEEKEEPPATAPEAPARSTGRKKRKPTTDK